MTRAKRDGGPAFPRGATLMTESQRVDRIPEQAGMSLRAWLTGQALAGLLANRDADGADADFAVDAVHLADAVLEALDDQG